MKLLQTSYWLSLFLGFAQIGTAQDPALFKIGNEEVKVSEFKYIYDKTNGGKADYSEKSVREYLDLYTKFKLKVKDGRTLKIDTTSSLKRELQGYRRQLSNSYLMDKEILEKLVKEAYDRSKKDVNISHIMISLPPNATTAQEKEVFEKINGLRKKAVGNGFEAVARETSDDNGTKADGGKLGYFTVLQLPYTMENAMYSTKVGEVSEPVRSHLGYHLIKVNDSRTARGEIKVAHILLRTEAGNEERNATAKKRIEEVYAKLQSGSSFESLVAEYSEDNGSKPKAGVLDWFGINRYDNSFEDAAFGLKDGFYCKPVQTEAGWHIIKRLESNVNPSFESAKANLTARIKNNDRFKVAQDVLVQRIKKDNNFRVNETVKQDLSKAIGENFINYQWKTPSLTNDDNLFFIGTNAFPISEFMKYAERNPAERVNRGFSTEQAIENVFNKVVSSKAMEYEENQLEKYNDFKALMREYEEGILLFETTKQQVWDKAANDSIGLAKFYAKNKAKYTWKQRALVDTYVLTEKDSVLLDKVYNLAKKSTGAKILTKINPKDKTKPSVLAVTSAKMEKTPEGIENKKGAISKPTPTPNGYIFSKVEKIIKPETKTLKEARGFVIADYQDYLEKEWIKNLQERYKVTINEEVVKSLIK